MPYKCPIKAKQKAKERYEKNKAMVAEKRRKYYEAHPEKKKEYMKKYGEKNKAIIAEKKKEYYQEHKEQKKEYARQQRQTPAGIKSQRISGWKKYGIICDDFDMLYANYLAETHCDLCRVKFGKRGDGTGTFKCCDHDHETGIFRAFLCCKCNLERGP